MREQREKLSAALKAAVEATFEFMDAVPNDYPLLCRLSTDLAMLLPPVEKFLIETLNDRVVIEACRRADLGLHQKELESERRATG